MSDSSKDWDVEVQYGGRPDTLPIRAPNKQAAEAMAAELLKRRRKRPDTKVIGATEVAKEKKKP